MYCKGIDYDIFFVNTLLTHSCTSVTTIKETQFQLLQPPLSAASVGCHGGHDEMSSDVTAMCDQPTKQAQAVSQARVDTL